MATSAVPAYHPLFCSNQFGELERSLLRPDNVHSAEDWQTVLEPLVSRYRGREIRLYFGRMTRLRSRTFMGFSKPRLPLRDPPSRQQRL